MAKDKDIDKNMRRTFKNEDMIAKGEKKSIEQILKDGNKMDAHARLTKQNEERAKKNSPAVEEKLQQRREELAKQKDVQQKAAPQKKLQEKDREHN